MPSKDAQHVDLTRQFFKRWPNFYYFVAVVFGPMMFCGLSAKGFLRKYPANGKKLNIGSGPKVLAAGVINIDLYPYEGVDVVTDIINIPLPDGVAERIICDTVLEHVENPDGVVKEMGRLLATNGLAYISVPLLYPFHSSPGDYHRWTAEGLKGLLGEFEILELGTRAGPFSAIAATLDYAFASLFSFGNERLYWLLLNLALLIFFPVKFLDILFNYLPNSKNAAAILYCVAKKK